MSAQGTRPSNRAVASQKISTTGEILFLTTTYVRRDRRAVRGFRVLPPRRRRRPVRKLRDSRKGRRGHRRRRFLTPLGAMLLKTHWSEGRELRRLRRLGARSNKLFVKKFISPLPKLFRFFYAYRRAAYADKKTLRWSHLFEKTRLLDASTAAARRQNHCARATNAALHESSVGVLTPLRKRRNREQLLRKQQLPPLVSSQLRRARRRRKTNQTGRVSKLLALRSAAAYTGRKFSAPRAELRGVGPLYFQNPVSASIKSEATKRRELEANVASKEARYKLTAQYIQNLTSFLPELINYMVSRKLVYSSEKISYSTARHLIRNIY